MAQSQLALYNLAISLCGGDYTIAAVSEASVPAEMCELWYEPTRQLVMRAAHWNSCERIARLVEDTERDSGAAWVPGDPSPGFAFSYTLPSDMLAARYLATFSRFKISYDDTGKTLVCDIGGSATTDAPLLIYTTDNDTVTEWEADLYLAMAYGLAGNVAIGLTGKRSKSADLFQLANSYLTNARANNANEQHELRTQKAASLQLRGYSQSNINSYVYPFGNLFAPPGAPTT